MMQNEIVVSIICPTFNHENFISKALDGFVNQKTNFQFEIIVHDDASKDQTSAVIRKYEQEYPHLFNVIYQKQNQFILGRHIWLDIMFPVVKGKYIALCEGDDYWTDTNKLQKQVDFLEANLEFSMCFTNHITVDFTGEIIQQISVGPEYARKLTHEDILANNYFIGTASVMIKRNSLPNPFPTPFYKAANGDYLLYCLATKSGKAAYLDFYSAAYRIHIGGTWTSRSSTQKYWAMYRTFLVAKKIFTTSSEQQALKKNLSKILQNLSWAYFELPKNEQIKFIFKSFIISLRFGVFKTWISINSDLITLFMKNKFKFKTA